MYPTAVCSICTDRYDCERNVAAMPCGHTFHEECLIRWLTNAKNCPSCRKTLRKNQEPIHRLFWDTDENLTICEDQDDNKAKLEAQVEELKSVVTKLESEKAVSVERHFTLTKALTSQESALKVANKTVDKLKKQLKAVNVDEETIADLKEQLKHLQNVKMIVDGLSNDVATALAERAGYTANQITYMLLMRQQLDDSRKTGRELREQVNALKNLVDKTNKKAEYVTSELGIAKLDLYHSERQNDSLRKKYEKLVRAIESPRGVAASLARRMAHESPAPSTFTPVQAKNSLKLKEKTTPNSLIDVVDNGDSQLVSSPNLFSDDSEYDLIDDVVQQTLFIEEKAPAVKKQKLSHTKAASTITTSQEASGESPFCSYSGEIKPKSTINLKVKSRTQPVRDISNLQSNKTDSTKSKSTFFRKGFNGMGGQNTSCIASNRVATAPKLTVFKKPAAAGKYSRSDDSKPVDCIYLD